MKKRIVLGSALCLAVLAVLVGGFFPPAGREPFQPHRV